MMRLSRFSVLRSVKRSSWTAFLAMATIFLNTAVGASSECNDVSSGKLGQLSSIKETANRLDKAYAKAIKQEGPPSGKKRFTGCILGAIVSTAPQKKGTKGYLYVMGLLEFLGRRRLSWEAPDPENVKRLKVIAKEAKAQTTGDPEYINALDKALSKSEGEFRSILRPKNGSYADFVSTKLRALVQTVEDGTYLNGPYEIFVNDLTAESLEEAAFLESNKNNQKAIKEYLEKALNLYSISLNRLSDPKSPATERQKQYFKNDFLFKKAMDLILLNRSDEAAEILSDIIKSTDGWKPDVLLDHIYVFKFVRYPYVFRFHTDANASEAVEFSDPHEIKIFFNPGQLAVFLCSTIDKFSKEGFPYYKSVEYLEKFENFDYRVYLSSSKNIKLLEGVLKKYNKKLRSLPKGENKKILKEINSAIELNISNIVAEGGKRCLGAQSDKISGIFQTFNLKLQGTWKNGNKKKGKTYGIYIGDYLSKGQARVLGKVLQRVLKLKTKPFIARPSLKG